MKKRLFERKSKKRDSFILIINLFMIYLLMSWDLVFGDVFALTPGYMLTLIYLLERKGFINILLSLFYAVLWALFYPTFLWLSPVLFIVFSLISILYNGQPKTFKPLFFLFYLLQLIFCVGFYNQFEMANTQFIQLALYFLVFFHIKVYKNRK